MHDPHLGQGKSLRQRSGSEGTFAVMTIVFVAVLVVVGVVVAFDHFSNLLTSVQ